MWTLWRCARLVPIRLTLFLLGCSTEAELYGEALGAGNWNAAQLGCSKLDAMRDVCLTQSMEKHRRLDPDDCGLVGAVAQDECRFLYAERQAQAGNADEAMRACTTTRFARECSYHLLREAVRPFASGSPAGAASALVPWREMPAARDAGRLFWKAYFREHLALGLDADPSGCPDQTCENAARETLFSTLNVRAVTEAATLCTTVPVVPRRWASTPEVVQWMDRWTERECRKYHLVPPARAIAAGP